MATSTALFPADMYHCQVNFVTTDIKGLTAKGIETVDGNTIQHDVVICATGTSASQFLSQYRFDYLKGYDISYRFPFPIIGRNGTDLRDKWTPHPTTYLSVCVDEFPNYFFSCGPNSCVGTGSFLIMIEHQVEYAVAAAAKMQRERLKSIEVKAEAVADFHEIIEVS